MSDEEIEEKGQSAIEGKFIAIDREWSTLRFLFWAIAIFITVIISQFLTSRQSIDDDFRFQNILFTGFALVGVVLGGVIGYRMHERKNLWVVADLVWTMIILISLWKILAPVENYLNEINLTSMRINEQGQKDVMLRKVWGLEDIFCATKRASSDECNTLKLIERELGLLSYKPNKNVGVVAKSLARLHNMQPDCGEVKKLLELLELHSDQYDAGVPKRVSSGEVSVWFPYLQIFILTLALSFRVGRTGAEYRRNKVGTK